MYPRYVIASVGAVLLVDNKILLIKRGYPPSRGLWSIPGGTLEPGETVYKAALRELFEETGLISDPLGILWVVDSIRIDKENKVAYHFVIIDVLFDSKSIRGEPRPGGDAVEVKWFSLEEALERRDVTSSTKKLVKYLIDNRSSLNTIPAAEDVRLLDPAIDK